MATCARCEKDGFGWLEVRSGFCPSCQKEVARLRDPKGAKAAEREVPVRTQRSTMLERSRNLLVTTETTLDRPVERLGVVVGEVVNGMSVKKDLFAGFRDFFGGRSKAVEQTLKDAREQAMAEMQEAAVKRGADAVVAVSLNYHSISTGSALNMMIVAATGTAVKFAEKAQDDSLS